MNNYEGLSCKLCGTPNPVFSYREAWRGADYSGYYCRNCDLYQTLGSIAPISPEYETLTLDDLTDQHIHLQTAHKETAFAQWRALMERHSGRPLAGKLLDVGCGVGGFLDQAKTYGLSVFGFDASTVQAEQARLRHPNVANCIDIDDYVATLPKGTKFDYITMWDVLEHIRDPKHLLAGIREHLAPDGLFFASVPGGGPTPLKLMFTSLLGRPPGLIPWEHVFYYTPNSLRLLLTENGFNPVDIGGVVPYTRSASLHEALRRTIFAILRNTNWALQIYSVAR